MNTIAPDYCEMHAIIKGRVQGVGFRATTRSYALLLSIKGTIRNLADGSVEIYAQGTKKSLEELIRKLKEETFLAHVEEISIQYIPVQKHYQDFCIIH